MLQGHLKFMEDFMTGKERPSVDMYSNCFLSLVGKYIYREVLQCVGEKHKERLKVILGAVRTVFLHNVAVVKIRYGLFSLFNTHWSARMLQFYKAKATPLDNNKTWLMEECEAEIIQHCKAIFCQEKPSSSKSMLKLMNSYIPYSKDNWMWYEMKKV